MSRWVVARGPAVPDSEAGPLTRGLRTHPVGATRPFSVPSVVSVAKKKGVLNHGGHGDDGGRAENVGLRGFGVSLRWAMCHQR